MRVKLSPRARQDLQDLVRYIARDSPSNARLVRERIKDAVQQLRAHPDSGRRGRVEGTRELVIPRTGYIAAYQAVNGSIESAAIIHEAQEWPTDL